MTHTSEVTTALAILAGRFSNDKTLMRLPLKMKDLFFQMYCADFLNFYNFSKDQEKEFDERFTKTIIIPWCYPEV